MTVLEFEIILIFISVMYFVGVYLLWFLFMGVVPLVLDGLRSIMLEFYNLIAPLLSRSGASKGPDGPSPSPLGGEGGTGRSSTPDRNQVKP
jgi:hypothetical protein